MAISVNQEANSIYEAQEYDKYKQPCVSESL